MCLDEPCNKFGIGDRSSYISVAVNTVMNISGGIYFIRLM
jgi:hypothetical protein